jgi:hypothetical protein
LYLEEYWDESVRRLRVAHEPTPEAHVAVFSPSEGKALEPIDYVEVTVGGTDKGIYDKKSTLAPNDVDSLFWTQSAALKFLYPYYARFYSQEKLAELYAACTNSLEGKNIYAIGHRFPTIYEEYTDDDFFKSYGDRPSVPAPEATRSPAWIRNEVVTVWSFTRSTVVKTTTLGEMLIATE